MKIKITQTKFTLIKDSYVKTCLFILFLICNYNVFAQTTYNITDPEALENQTYVAGDIIILANGTYSTDARIDFIGNGTVDDPIIFMAETPGGVKFTGGLQMNIGGDYVVVDGFHWQGGYGASNFIQFRNGTDYANYSTIKNCAIDGLAIHPDDVADDIANNSITKHRWIVLYGTYNSVINCSFMNKESAGALILAEYQYNAEDDRCATVGHTISNNYFFNYVKILEFWAANVDVDGNLSNSGDSETIRIGTSEYQNVNSNVTVSNNYFVEADGENEIITNKSKGNTYTNNTFRKCRGSLVLRHGSDATVDGNYFLGEDVDGTGGIRITDSNHTITNNYIQDCININSQAKWNNGITFIGGGDSAAVVCTSTSVSNGYQKSENINVSNNSIVNTNAPLFYNTDKGSTDPTGSVNNNLIFFADGNSNKSEVISGDTGTSYADMGTTLAYTGNVWKGANGLGATNTGFSEETGITATADGEIFTFTGASGKGAVMGSYTPIKDNMVGYGIGACFLDYEGIGITNGDCDIEIPESLTVGSLSTLSPDAGSYDVTVTANVGWSAVSNDAWITTINPISGTGDATVSITVTENTDTSSRTGTVTFTQDTGGDDIVRTLTITQEGADLTSLYTRINDVPGGGPVSIHSFSAENPDKPEENAPNTLDKDNLTIWAAQDGAVLGGDYKGDGEYIIYDLGSNYNLDLIQFSTTSKSDPFGYQIWVSTTPDPNPIDDFSMVLPETGDLLLTETNSTDFNQYLIDVEARYVKMLGFGRFNSAGDSRTSAWSAIAEIEFFGELTSLSVADNEFKKQVRIYPNPATDNLSIKSEQININTLKVYNLDGRLVLKQSFKTLQSEVSIDTSSFSNGMYLVNLSNVNGSQLSQLIIVSH